MCARYEFWQGVGAQSLKFWGQDADLERDVDRSTCARHVVRRACLAHRARSGGGSGDIDDQHCRRFNAPGGFDRARIQHNHDQARAARRLLAAE